jgi:hypothetical protein
MGDPELDLDAMREEQIAAFSEDEILDLDGPLELRSELVKRLSALSHRAFLGCAASCLADLRAAYGDGLSGDGLDLVERSLVVAASAADGQPVARDAAKLYQDWCRFMQFDPDDEDEDDEPVVTDVVNDLQGPCAVIVWAIADDNHRFEAAEAIARSADSYVDWDVAGENVRLLLRFIARANEARAREAALR